MKEKIQELYINGINEDIAPNVFADKIISLFSELQKELDVTEKLLNERQRVLDAIPECPAHGSCVPNAIEWVEKHKKISSPLRSLINAEKENRIIKLETFRPFMEEDRVKCYFFWIGIAPD